MKPTTSHAMFACMAIAAMLMAPMSVSMSEASGGATYDPEMVEYIRTVISETGTYTVVEDSAHNVITTNTVTLDGSVYTVHTTTTASGEVINEETVYITPTRNGMYGFENSARNIDVRFTDQESYAQGQPSQSRTSATITLSDRAYAEDGEVITLTDDYRGCSGNYATFTAGVDTADDTLMTWRAQSQFFSYCFLYQGFDYIKITHEGHTITSTSTRSSADMSNSNGEGWYSAYVKVYYD